MVDQDKHRDPYRAFFTVDEALGGYMASLLRLEESDTLLEPAAGDGHLIDASQSILPSVDITAYELHPKHAENLRNKYRGEESVKIFQKDSIFCSDLDLRETSGPKFSKIIANPPYGGWQEYARRADLKKRFPGFYVRETYTMFLLRSLSLLKKNGRLIFIIPDTFLYLHLHSPIRRFIIEGYSIESIDVFKSSLFPTIAFGYAGMCIISIRASTPASTHTFNLRSVNHISEFNGQSARETTGSKIPQKNILNAHDHSIPVSPSGSELEQATLNTLTMADVADCVTGFYSGNDKAFLRRASKNVKRSNGYDVVDPYLIEDDPFSRSSLLDGIEDSRCFVPILKGGGYNFIKPTQWYVDWSKQAVSHYKTDKGARFQNSSYYFRRGIGFPMVTSTRPTAALIEEALFDQSIVGIFPKSSVSLEFLLAYCNSLPFWRCLKAINPSANNSARYILRTPIILPDAEEQERIAEKTKELLQLIREEDHSASVLQEEILDSINNYVKEKVSNKDLDKMAIWAADRL